MSKSKATNGHMPDLTPALAFRLLREVGKVETLSTGRVVRWRPVRPARLLREDKIPDHLIPYVMRILWDGRGEDTRDETQKAKDWFDYKELMVACGLMHPVTVLGKAHPGPDEIHIDDLEPEEIEYLYDSISAPLTAVQSFRRQPGEEERAMADSPEGDALPQVAA